MTLTKKTDKPLSAREKLRAQLAKKKTLEVARREGRVGIGANGAGEHMVLVLDLSGSMYCSMDWRNQDNNRKVDVLKDAARGLLAKSMMSHAAIVFYGDEPQEHRDFAHAPSHRDLDMPQMSLGTTEGSLALELAAGKLANKAGLRRIIFMSDGCDNRPDRLRQVAASIRGSGIIIDSVAFGADADRALLLEIAGNGTMVEGNDAPTLKRQFLALEARTRGLLGSGR